MERGLVDIPQDRFIIYNTISSGKHSVNIWNQFLPNHNKSGILYPQPLCRANHKPNSTIIQSNSLASKSDDPPCTLA